MPDSSHTTEKKLSSSKVRRNTIFLLYTEHTSLLGKKLGSPAVSILDLNLYIP